MGFFKSKKEEPIVTSPYKSGTHFVTDVAEQIYANMKVGLLNPEERIGLDVLKNKILTAIRTGMVEAMSWQKEKDGK